MATNGKNPPLTIAITIDPDHQSGNTAWWSATRLPVNPEELILVVGMLQSVLHAYSADLVRLQQRGAQETVPKIVTPAPPVLAVIEGGKSA